MTSNKEKIAIITLLAVVVTCAITLVVMLIKQPKTKDIERIPQTKSEEKVSLDYYVHNTTTVEDFINDIGEPLTKEYIDDMEGYYILTYPDKEIHLYNSYENHDIQLVGYIHIPSHNTNYSVLGFHIGMPRSELKETVGDLHIDRKYEYTDDAFEDNEISYQYLDYDNYVNITFDDKSVTGIEYIIPV